MKRSSLAARLVALVALVLTLAMVAPPPPGAAPIDDAAEPAAPFAELLGPLTPIALSPFFGVTCLSGLAFLEDQGAVPENQFLTRADHLRSPVFFFIFAALSLLTSLPRMTKVSKPLAQGLDLLETCSGIVTFTVIRILAAAEGTEPPVVVEAGAFSLGIDSLVLLASAINIFVITTLRFFFEVLIWLSPVPLIDALFEASNKVTCAGLMALYAYSPTAATALNLVLFVIAAITFRWTLRRTHYWRSLGFDPLWQRLTRRHDLPSRCEDWSIKVFARDALGPFPAKQELRLVRRDGHFVLRRESWWRATREHVWAPASVPLSLRKGMLGSALRREGGETLLLTRAHHDQLDRIEQEWGVVREQGSISASAARAELA